MSTQNPPSENQPTPKPQGDAVGLVSSDLFGVFVRILNEAYEADPAALHTLICYRVPCNQALADHPTVQVASEPFAKTEYFSVGLLGVINGICEPLTGKRVAVKFSEPDPTTKRSKILGFTEYLPNVEMTDGYRRHGATTSPKTERR
jgi:hypothetical protein